MKILAKTYNTYKRRCQEIKGTPISYEQFRVVLEKQKKILSYLLQLGRTAPWIVSEIDKDFVMYAAIKESSVIINVWSNDECKGLTGIGEGKETDRAKI